MEHRALQIDMARPAATRLQQPVDPHHQLVGQKGLAQEILGPGMKTALLLPFTRAAVPTIDLAARRVIIDLPEGLE